MTEIVKIVIPARYGSSRFPGKPLALIDKKPMIWHVYQRALESGVGEENIFVAIDDERISSVVKAFGGQVAITASEHSSGTDRIAEVAQKLKWDDSAIVVNLQGDEPFTNPDHIKAVVDTLSETGCAVSTLAVPFSDLEMVKSPRVVKVVTDIFGRALYFSRSPIPFVRDEADIEELQREKGWLRHLGIYCYRVSTLKTIFGLLPTDAERFEKLEQLRMMQRGLSIGVGVVHEEPIPGVDTPEDLERINSLISERKVARIYG